MKRSLKQTAKIVEKTVIQINSIIKAANLMRDYSWFNYNEFKTTGLDILISKICNENEIDEKHVRTVLCLELENND